MYTHELTLKHAIEHHDKLIQEAQTNKLKTPRLRKTLATLLYKLADQLEPQPIQAELALRN